MEQKQTYDKKSFE